MTDIINGDIYKYFGTEEALSEASHITNVNTGERVELSNNTKALYARMRKRFHFFTTSNIGGNKGIYHDNVEELAASVGISKRTALRCLDDLKQVGLVIANLSGRSNQWIVTDLTPDAFRLERRTGTTADPVWIDCLKNPVFGNAKEDVAPEVQEEKQQPIPETDPMCEFDELSEDETPAPEKVKPAPKPAKKPAARKAPAKQQTVSPFEFKSPRDETKDWFYLKHYQGAERFTTFTDFDLPYLALFKEQGSLTNAYALDYLQLRTDQIQQQLARNT
ncbi:TPA: ArsR family transcriptional regulator [Klebsiella pneumoniae]|nr:ArsR family transcriptional regulator [Klebsiella pneumoniae]AXS54125.1 ArsR family transcriptional regulator [Klebsiella pneumoniae]HCI6908499.1 ArsR family transcriptional regulator [Klebsiella pneumoniae]